MKAWWNGRRGKGRPKGPTPEILSQVVSLLGEEERSFKEILTEAKRLYGFHHTTLLKYLKHLVDIGFVSETHRGKRVFYRKLFPDLSSPRFEDYLIFRIGWSLPLLPPGEEPTVPGGVRALRLHLLTFPQVAGEILRNAQRVPREKRGDFIRTMGVLFLTPLMEALELWGRYDLPEEVLKEAEEPLKRAMYETLGFWYRDEKREFLKLWEGEPPSCALINRFLEAKYGKEVLRAPLEKLRDLMRRPDTFEGFWEFWEEHPRELRKILKKMKEMTKRRRELVKGFIRREYPKEWREIYAKWLKLDKEIEEGEFPSPSPERRRRR